MELYNSPQLRMTKCQIIYARPLSWFVARRSIQLSYGRAVHKYDHRPTLGIQPLRKANFKMAGKRTARSRSCVRLNGDRSGRGSASIRLRVPYETPAVRFGTEPEQRCQR